MSPPILSVQELTTPLRSKGRTFYAVEGLSFDLYLGKTLALVGESGCGKSLTALSLLRILPTPPCLPPMGKVIYRDKNLLTLSEREMRRLRGARIAMIFQDPSSALNPVYTIGAQLIEVAELHLNLFGEEAFERAVQMLEDVAIPEPRERMEAYPHQLSGGMKQRVMIAMALMCEPDILIADEPTTALDVTIQAQVLDLMCDLQRKKGMALLLITHDMGVVAKMADDVVVMYTAQGVEKGSVYQVFDKMAHPYTMGLFHSRPDPERPKERLQPIQGMVPSLGAFPAGCRFHPRCPFVMEKCRAGPVPHFLVPGGEGEHRAKCWLHDGSIESEERKKQ